MKLHPIRSEVAVAAIPHLEGVASLVRNHHEWWDGRRYPESLKGEQIPMLARVLTACDSYDAMTSNRAYRPLRDHEEAMREIAKGTGAQF